MERLQPRAKVAVPVSALALAAGAAACFGVGNAVGFLSDATESVFIGLWLLGWMLLAGAAIIGGGFAVSLGLRWASRRPVFGWETALAAASLVLIAVVVVSHPLWGTGSGAGG
jgi:hypothetical protein